MALIPPNFLKSVISIDLLIGRPEKLERKTIATGFIVGKEMGKNEKGQVQYRLFIVTNRHVFVNKNGQYLKNVFFRFNKKDEGSHLFAVNLLDEKSEPLWLKHDQEDVDLAILPINGAEVLKVGADIFVFTEKDSFFAKDFGKKNISAGDELFVLGFPRSISGDARNFVIIRHGIIARVDDELLKKNFYYIDASAYPGNSGGPVIIKPEICSIEGTAHNSLAGLVGVVSGGETYSDIAISQQTGEVKAISTEQMGLVRVVPIELVFDIINSATDKKVEEADVKVEA
jgi:S1-C subfamily serine protease